MAVQYRVTHLLADLGQPNLVREEMGHPVDAQKNQNKNLYRVTNLTMVVSD